MSKNFVNVQGFIHPVSDRQDKAEIIGNHKFIDKNISPFPMKIDVITDTFSNVTVSFDSASSLCFHYDTIRY